MPRTVVGRNALGQWSTLHNNKSPAESVYVGSRIRLVQSQTTSQTLLNLAQAQVTPPIAGSRQRVIRREIDMESNHRRLMWHGMFLFLLGLLTGLAEERFTNVRMGLAAHLEGVMNGTFLVALGAIWMEVRLPPLAKTVAFWSVL